MKRKIPCKEKIFGAVFFFFIKRDKFEMEIKRIYIYETKAIPSSRQADKALSSGSSLQITLSETR